MKKYMGLWMAMLLLVGLVGCQEKAPTNQQNPAVMEEENEGMPPFPVEMEEEELVKIVAKNLGVPKDVEYTYKVGYTSYEDAGRRYYRNVNLFVDDESVAFASVDPATGELLKNIVAYGKDVPTDFSGSYEEFLNSFVRVEKRDQNYTLETSFDFSGYRYSIYDNAGNLLDEGFHDYRGSFDITKDGNLVTLEYGFGGTNVHPRYRFYDVETGLVSRWFSGPVAVCDTLVAYFQVDYDTDVATLVVQDMFDPDKNLRMFPELFDDKILLTIQDIAFSEDGQSVKIEYCEYGNEENVIKEEYALKQSVKKAAKPKNEMDQAELAKVVAKSLCVPDDLKYTYEIGELYYWDAGDIWYRRVAIRVEDGVVAMAAVDPTNGDLLKNIMEYQKSE